MFNEESQLEGRERLEEASRVTHMHVPPRRFLRPVPALEVENALVHVRLDGGGQAPFASRDSGEARTTAPSRLRGALDDGAGALRAARHVGDHSDSAASPLSTREEGRAHRAPSGRPLALRAAGLDAKPSPLHPHQELPDNIEVTLTRTPQRGVVTLALGVVFPVCDVYSAGAKVAFHAPPGVPVIPQVADLKALEFRYPQTRQRGEGSHEASAILDQGRWPPAE